LVISNSSPLEKTLNVPKYKLKDIDIIIVKFQPEKCEHMKVFLSYTIDPL